MRDLILMRGAPGSGKSTWVREHHLEPYTISSDAVRLLYSQPVYDEMEGIPHIAQRNDQMVWDTITEVIKLRMQSGQFLVLDAQNIRPQRWLGFAERYRYRVWHKTIDATLEECLQRNKQRERYQWVPENVIRAADWRASNNNLPASVKPVFDDLVAGDIQPKNVDEYKAVYICGDIHGCMHPLKLFFDSVGGPSPEHLYIFVGDYLDRGIQNMEVLDFFCSHAYDTNFMFLEGNHIWEKLWANDWLEDIKYREFLLNTVPQIESIDKKRVREWTRRWAQLAYIEYHGVRYFITHAGLGFMPEHPRFIPSKLFIKGESYDNDVDRAWCEKCYGHNLVQVHGHRNTYCYDIDDNPDSINLNSAVEFGEDWRVLGLVGDDRHYLLFENTVHRAGMNMHRKAAILEDASKATPQERVELWTYELRHCGGIQEKQLPRNISSFNFTRDVFYSMAWDDISTVARGLFIDTLNWRIVARSYQKFFNYQERDINSTEWLKENLSFPVSAYRKYNGFLAMVSWDRTNNRMFYASKSTTESTHAEIARKMIEGWLIAKGTLENFQKWLQENDVTVLFEVCTQDDPHIIYEGEVPVLLDVVDNTINFHKMSRKDLLDVAFNFEFSVKVLDATYYNWDDLVPALKDKWCINCLMPIEGWVLEDANGYNFKLKTDYYQSWKRLRRLMELVDLNIQNVLEFAPDDLTKEIVTFMQKMYEGGTLEGKSIIQVRNFWLKLGGRDFPYRSIEENTNG